MFFTGTKVLKNISKAKCFAKKIKIQLQDLFKMVIFVNRRHASRKE